MADTHHSPLGILVHSRPLPLGDSPWTHGMLCKLTISPMESGGLTHLTCLKQEWPIYMYMCGLLCGLMQYMIMWQYSPAWPVLKDIQCLLPLQLLDYPCSIILLSFLNHLATLIAAMHMVHAWQVSFWLCGILLHNEISGTCLNVHECRPV